MQNETPNIGFKTERAGFASLIICGFQRDENITQVARVSAKRQYVRWLVESTVVAVIATHLFVGDEHHGKWPIFNPQHGEQRLEEPAQLSTVDRMFALLVDQYVVVGVGPPTVSPRFPLFVQIGVLAGARGFARCMTRTLLQCAAQADGAQRLCR